MNFSRLFRWQRILKGSLVIAFVFDYNVFFLFICLLVRSSKKHCKSSIHLIIISMVGFWGFGA